MKGILVLAGSGEFTPSMETPDKYILSRTKVRNVAILPTAAGKESDWHKWVEMGERHFRKLGVDAFGLNVLNASDANNPKKFVLLEKADFVYISGGDPGHLFHTLNKSLLWKNILEKFGQGMILAGSSAGAMAMGKYVLANAQRLDKESSDWINGLGMVPFSIIPHYDYIKREEPQMLEKINNETHNAIKKTFMGIDEDTALMGESNSKARVKGKGAVYLLDKNREYKSGSNTFLLLAT